MHRKGLGGMGQALVPPLILQRLADLMLGTELDHRLALSALHDAHGLGFGVPFPVVHG
jgi:hypothetical protein